MPVAEPGPAVRRVDPGALELGGLDLGQVLLRVGAAGEALGPLAAGWVDVAGDVADGAAAVAAVDVRHRGGTSSLLHAASGYSLVRTMVVTARSALSSSP
jgi:hypothetical protein